MRTDTASSKATGLLKRGELTAAINALVHEVKEHPVDTWRRTFLFELLCFNGEWERAEKQLGVIALQDVKAEVGAQAYLNNLKAERARQRLFQEGEQPHFITEPPAYVDLYLKAINLARLQKFTELRSVLEDAEIERNALPGHIVDQSFDDFRDISDLTAPVLEIFITDKYTWLPLEQVRRIEVETPAQLRDLLWPKARIEAVDNTIAEVFLPAIYPASSLFADETVRLGRRTDWQELGGGIYLPVGLRIFTAGEADKTIFELKELSFGASAAAVAARA